MSQSIRIALDAMGGDRAPASIVEGAILAAREYEVDLLLVGDEEVLRAELSKHRISGLSLSVVPASQKVEMDESPASVLRKKRESSIWVATTLVKDSHAEAVISAGNTGASMAVALFVLGPLQGVERPAIATFLPTLTGRAILLDAGANVDCKPHHLFQFAIMGHVYAQAILGHVSPRIGLLSIGEEDTKGNELTREAFRLLKGSPLNFVGNLEGKDVYRGNADVVVCDGFIGNVALKISEGLADAIVALFAREIERSLAGRLGYLLLRSSIIRFRKEIDYAEYGGAPLLGVDGISIICHGRSDGRAIKNAIRVAGELVRRGVNASIKRGVASMDVMSGSGKWC